MNHKASALGLRERLGEHPQEATWIRKKHGDSPPVGLIVLAKLLDQFGVSQVMERKVTLDLCLQEVPVRCRWQAQRSHLALLEVFRQVECIVPEEVDVLCRERR